jgi:hypothetical protein
LNTAWLVGRKWAAEDIIRNRPALSRWHPDYADEFAEFLTLEAPFQR